MAVTYGFFDSVNGDRKYNADDISNYFLKLISNGVFATPASAMQVQAGSGMAVDVSAGWGFINCKWINNDGPYNLTIDASDIVLNRIDRIVLQLDPGAEARCISIAVKKGTPAATPAPPVLTRNTGGVWELSLAQIAVNAGVTSISQSDITDERGNTSVCGYVTGLIDQIDTTNLFAQYNTAFNEWFTEIKDAVRTTTIVIEYRNLYETTDASETVIPIGITQYNDTLDILHVYINGMKLAPVVDYTAADGNITLTKALDVIGTPVEFVVLKSVDTEDASSIADEFLLLFNQVQQHESRITALENRAEASSAAIQGIQTQLGGLSLRKMTKLEFDALTIKDPNTIYYVIDNNKITQYVGDTKLSAGTFAGNAVRMLQNPLIATFGNAIESE